MTPESEESVAEAELELKSELESEPEAIFGVEAAAAKSAIFMATRKAQAAAAITMVAAWTSTRGWVQTTPMAKRQIWTDGAGQG